MNKIIDRILTNILNTLILITISITTISIILFYLIIRITKINRL